MADGEGMLVPPHSGFGEDDEAANPTDFLLVLGPLRTDLEMVGLVEIFQRSDAGANVQQGYLRFLLQMCELAADFLKSHQLRHFSDRQVLWARLEEFTRDVHASLEPIQTAYTIANEGRRLIECDRVSVAIRQRQPLHDRGRQRPGRVRQAIEHRSACWAGWPRPWWPPATRCGTPATPATWPRRSKTPCRNTSTRRTRR